MSVTQELSSSLTTLMPMLRCPSCRSDRRLEMKPGRIENGLVVRSLDEHLQCGNCNAQYALTDDYIPLMIRPDVLAVYRNIDSDAAGDSPLAANIAIYDAFSDNYHESMRRAASFGQCMIQATRRLVAQRRQNGQRWVHLDFGCGPGHVMEWLSEFNFLQIGLDVSLNNLRNARKYTGCLAVCGDACNMPFVDRSMDLVTESSALHHILDWQDAVREAIRVCSGRGGIVLDDEPSREQLAWSRLAVAVFNLRLPIYKVLSYLQPGKYMFRDTKQARLNLLAEFHHQPGTGLDVDAMRQIFQQSEFEADVILSPTPELQSKAHPAFKSVLMSLLSARNLWNPAYGPFSVVARSGQAPSN